MDEIGNALTAYAREATNLASAADSSEATFYPAIHRLLTTILRARSLPFEARANTIQRRTDGGPDLPDFAFYDGAGDFVVVYGEVKAPAVEIRDLALSTEGNDQIGRYLARTGVVLLCNIRSFGILAVDPTFQEAGPVPPEHRQLIDIVELWPSLAALTRGRAIDIEAAPALAELIETAVTEWAPIAEPESLARILARQARRAKADLPHTFSNAVQPLLEDFAEALGLTFEGSEGEEFLRSSLIQTAFYGLFASWTLWRHSNPRRDFHWRDLGDYLKIPFLGALFYEFRHPVRLKELRLAPHLDRATATLHRVAQDRFFGHFAATQVIEQSGHDSLATNAILYFYEPFLEAFDPNLRKKLGVWYTPQEIVQYQVGRAEQLLREELDCPRGLADDRVVVLDPCCGTGAYLIEVLRRVARQLQEEGVGAALASKLLDAFCSRIIGFEILTAPFVIAHLQVYLLLSQLGVEPDESHRPAIFLTNALTGWDGPEQLKLKFPELQQEHDAAQSVKREAKIIVVLGNPPYDRWAGTPMEEEQELADHYKGIRRDAKGRQVGQTELYTRFGIRKQLLNELYLRFFRLGEIRIGVEAEHGVVSWISNSSYLAGRSHPLMRESLLKSFDQIWIDRLNGDKYRTGKIIPKGLPGEGTSDQSVFTTTQDPRGIQVGTAISTFLKYRSSRRQAPLAQVWFRDFWGMSAAKRQALVVSLSLDELPDEERLKLAGQPGGPRAYEPLMPTERSHWRLVPTGTSGGYEDWPALDDLFVAKFQGVNPARGLEGSLVSTDPDELAGRMADYFSPNIPFEVLRERYPVLLQARAEYEPEQVRKELLSCSRYRRDQIVDYLLFPLDRRFVYYETESKLLTRRSPQLWDHLSPDGFLVTVPHARQVSEALPLIASSLFDYHLHDRGSFGFPVQVKPEEEFEGLFSILSSESQESRANIESAVWETLKRRWELEGDLTGQGAKQLVLKLFHFTLAVAHAPQYQLNHQDALANDWLHLPIPKDRDLFDKITLLGQRVGTLLNPMADATRVLKDVLGSDRRTLAVPSTRGKGVLHGQDFVITISYFGAARGGWERRLPKEREAFHPTWGEMTGDLYLNETAYLANVPERIWRYELGGYPIIKKWLGYRDEKRRPNHPLTHGEFDHLRGMVHRIAALLLLHELLDQAYEKALEAPFTAEELGL